MVRPALRSASVPIPHTADAGAVSATVVCPTPPLGLLDYGTREEVRLSDDPALAFYWSPDGSKAAYVTYSDGAEGSLRFGVVEVDSGELTYLPDFVPSQE